MSAPVSGLHCVLVPYLSLHCGADQRPGWTAVSQSLVLSGSEHYASLIPIRVLMKPSSILCRTTRCLGRRSHSPPCADACGLGDQVAGLTRDCVPSACGKLCVKFEEIITVNSSLVLPSNHYENVFVFSFSVRLNLKYVVELICASVNGNRQKK